MRKILFLFVFLIVVPTAIYAQKDSTITIRLENVTIRKAVQEIQDKSVFRFFYSDDTPLLDKEVSLRFRKSEITQVMDSLLLGSDLSYKVLEGNLIVIATMEGFQQHEVTGQVISSYTGETIPGANVFIKGSSTGTVTDPDGRFSIIVPDGETILTISFIGYDPAEIPSGGQTDIKVVLEESTEKIKEVVITGLNISREKSSLGYSVTQVGSEEINQAKENNPINSLTGKVAGLQITKAPTGVDGSSRVILRGIASLLGNNRPLFVIDGIPMDAGYGGAGRWGGTDSGDGLSDLNPEDIESMSVLKGAGASAVYGSRGANGVILITTKSGRSRKGIGVSLSSNFMVETPMVTPDFNYDYGQGSFGSYPPLTGNPPAPNKDYPWIWSFGSKMEGQTLTDWLGNEAPLVSQPNPYDEFFRTGSTFTNTIAFDGGNEKTLFRASITNQDSKGIMPNNNLSRQTINLRGSSKLTEKLEFDAKITYILTNVENRPSLAEDGANIVQVLNIMPRNITLQSLKDNIADADGNELKWTTDNTFSNPYWILENKKNADRKNRLQAMFSLNWDLAKDFSFIIRSGFDYLNRNAKAWENPGRPSMELGKGNMNQSMNNGVEWNSDFLLTYNKKIKDFNLNISAGGNYRYHQSNGISIWGSVMRVPEFYNISNYKNYGAGEWHSEKAVYSLYGLGQFSFKNYLYLDVTARNDWSSTLPSGNNAYFYHSENLSFVFTEAFGISNYILSNGKFRASYAKVGNDTGPYQIDQYYSINQTQTDYPLASIGGQLPHFDLQPEETHSWEIGTNLGFLNRRLELDVAYYNSISDKQIMPVQLTPSTGYSSKYMNAGKIQNTGFEVQLNANPVSTNGGFNWNIILTWSKNNSMVKELYGDTKYLPLADEFHMTLEAHVDQPYGVIYTFDYKRDAFGNKLIDNSGYAQAGEWTAMGNINPDWMGGLSNHFSYKGFNLSFLIDFQKGGDIYSWGKSYRALFGTSKETLEGRAEWYAGTGGYVESGINENTGQKNDIAIQPTYRWYNLFNRQIGTEWIQDATNIRMRELVFGYTFPTRWFASTPISNLQISLVGRNLFFFYRAMDGADPESGFNSGNTGTGIEHLSLPSTSSYGVNLKINF